MAKQGSEWTCTGCGAKYGKWFGRCTKCGEYDTLKETTAAATGASVGLRGQMRAGNVTRPAQRVRDVDVTAHRHTPTGIGAFDRVLGGGFVAGAVILFSGEPGAGKSTLTLSVAHSYAEKGKSVLYVSGEESVEQITLRARRIGADSENLYLADETDLSVILGQIDDVQPDLVVVDSIQTMASPDVDGRAGGIAQVQEVTAILTRVAKSRHIPMIIIGQVTKDGNLAGPRTLEHAVDQTISLEGDKQTALRILRTGKNRFGSTDAVSVLEQTEKGLVEVEDPSALFRTGRAEPVPGTCVTVTLEGRRALLAEVQALVAPTAAPNPRRGVSGLDSARIAMLIAVTERHGRLRMYDKDTYLATVAGMRITEPSADLGICLAIASAALELPLPLDVIAFGEVALSGDVRPVSAADLRLAEAARMGYKRALVPAGTIVPKGTKITVIPVDHLRFALAALKQMAPKQTEATE